MAYNNLSQFRKAEQMYSAAAKGFAQNFSTHFYFITRINLFWVHYNQKNRLKMELELTEIQKCPIDSEGEALRVLRCKLSFALSIENFDACDETIFEIENKSSSMSEAFNINFLIDKFNLEVKRSNFELCQQYLHEMKKYRKYYLTSNYNFMKTLLDHYLKNTPIYVNETDFKDSPYLLLQLKVIQKLQERNLTEVQVLWNKLKCEARDIYGTHFIFHGDRCLFSLCLDKQKIINQNLLCDNPKPNEEVILKGNKITKLFHIVKNLKGPITKEELFHLVWGVPAQEKEDLAKLSHAVSRLHKEFGIRLKSKRGCYCLDQENEAA